MVEQIERSQLVFYLKEHVFVVMKRSSHPNSIIEAERRIYALPI